MTRASVLVLEALMCRVKWNTVKVMICVRINTIAVVFVGSLAMSGIMNASTIAFYLNSTDTASGTASPFVVGSGQPWLSSGQNLNAEVFFTTNGSTLTVELVNLITNEVTDGQSISGISFKIADSGGSIPGTVTPTASGYGSDSNHSNGQMIDIAPGGAVTNAGACGSTCLGDWAASTSLAGGVASISMDSFPGAPDTISGVAASNGYPHGNPSLTNSNHQPEFEEMATFTLSGLTGLGDSSTISNVVFNFGTESGQTVAVGRGFNETTPTPEPGTLSMMFGGASLLLAGFWKRRRNQAQR